MKLGAPSRLPTYPSSPGHWLRRPRQADTLPDRRGYNVDIERAADLPGTRGLEIRHGDRMGWHDTYGIRRVI
jgi:hypothetical protein